MSQPRGLASTEGSQVVKPNGKLSSPTHPLEKHGPDASDAYLKDRVKNELINSKRTGSRTALIVGKVASSLRDQELAAKGTGTGKAPYTSTVSPDAEAGMPYAHPVKEAGPKASVDAPKGGPTYRPADSDQFEKILTSYYGANKTGSRVGNGGLADSVRYDKATGDMLCPAGYEQKAIEVSNRLSDLVRYADNQPPGKYPYSQRDIDFAKQLMKDFDNALGR